MSLPITYCVLTRSQQLLSPLRRKNFISGCYSTDGHVESPNTDGRSIGAGTDENESRSSAEGDDNLKAEDKSSAGQPRGDQSPRNVSYAHTALEACGSKQRTTDQNPPLEPPVTKASLSELDVNKIVHSPKLRHDINFDPTLHFRPNMDGEKGRRKRDKASDFWTIMRGQLRAYLENREQFEKELAGKDWILPVTLKAIREILEMLVPRDQASVEDTFNVDLLMQQFRKGVADLVRLATWLSQLIKRHCAPMRDAWVDEMVLQLSRGSQTGDVTLLAGGIGTLLGILEVMKLDVANHQIRCLRPLLIEDTVHFEQKFFMRKIALGRIDLTGAHAWYKRACGQPDIVPLDPTTPQLANAWNLTKGLVNLVLPSKSDEIVPHTFVFDEERLVKLRGDIEDSINIEICMRLFRGLEIARRRKMRRSIPCDNTPVTSPISSPFDRPASPDNTTLYSSTTLPLPQFASKFRPHFVQTCSEPTQSIGSQGRGSNIESDFISLSSVTTPFSSPSTASTPDTYSPMPFYPSQYMSDSADQVRNSLLDILDSSMTSARWTDLAPSLALQIVCSTTTPQSQLLDIESELEAHLEAHLSNPNPKVYQDAEQQVLGQLFPILRKLVETYTPLTCLQIFELAAEQNSPLQLTNSQTDSSKDEITEIATKIAHIGILHWRVWAPLAYLVNPDEPVVEQDQSMT